MTEEANREEYEETIKKIRDINGNMAVLSQLDTILRDYNSSLFDAEQLIKTDGGISATIIKLSNTALYNSTGKSKCISTALQQVGFDQTLKLVSMALSKQVFMRDLDAYGISADEYWRYSYFTAVFMETQARRCGVDSNNAYLLGLLHSIGRVVVNELLRSKQVEVYWDRFVTPALWEKATIGFTSDTAGSILLRSWDFSTEIYQRVGVQTKPRKRGSDTLLMLLDFTHQLAIALNDPEMRNTLCKTKPHPYLKRFCKNEEELEIDIASTEAYVNDVHGNLKNC